MKKPRLVFSLLILAVLAGSLAAQTETGQITGTITDPTGAAVPGVKVTVQSAGTGAIRTVESSADGTYTVTNLLPAEYTITVAAPGFVKVERRVTVAVGTKVGQDIRLEVASAATTVEVSESATQVNTEIQTLGQVITQNQIRELPNLTRNPYQFVALSGNVS